MAECIKCGGQILTLESPCAACGDKTSRYNHDQINAAYRAGIRKCIQVLECGGDPEGMREKMMALYRELYC